MTIIFRSDFDVELVESMGSDELICWAARVSTLGAASLETSESAGLIRFLMSNRHGTPFEHAAMTFRIGGPIAMWREFMRHRIGVSYNEQSARYMELDPVFYIPPVDRNLVQNGKPGQYAFGPGTAEQYHNMRTELEGTYKRSWDAYKFMLKDGIAKEVARFALPVAIYSTAYVTMNPRSLMHFLSLRTKQEHSTFPSFPQWEINQVADQMEVYFAVKFPITWAAYDNAGRVCP